MRRRLPLFLLLAALTVPAAGCGGGNSGAAEHARVNIVNFGYSPTPVTIAAGGTVTWTDSDRAPHTATAQDQKTFDTGTLTTAKSKTITFSKPGTYTYFCRFHPFMHGTIVVK